MNKERKIPEIHLVCLNQYPILHQLHLEEALLRTNTHNWCVINQNPPDAIVLGISAQPEQVIDFNFLQQKKVPVIRRFSGGGTVFIDENCLMVTFICNQSETQVPCFPQPVFQWSESIYHPVFGELGFSLRENDYVISNKKFGGNAQYMTKGRWLHHTSFLWDYHVEKMKYLKMPPKMPSYRQTRSHQDFLCTLKDFFLSPDHLLEKFFSSLKTHFKVHKSSLAEIEPILHIPHRRTSDYVKIES